MKEVVLIGMPSNSTTEFVTGICSNYGLVVSCELLHNKEYGLMVKLEMASAASAQGLVRNLNGNMAVGLKSPLFVGSFEDCGWMWPA